MSHRSMATAAVLALAAATMVTLSCSGTSSVSGGMGDKGHIRMVLGGGAQAATLGAASATTLADGSGRTITDANISISSILARNLNGELVGVGMDLPFSVDLIDLIDGKTVDLPIGSLPAGSYDQLVIVIKSLHVVLSDGTQIDVTPPGGGWTAIVPTEPFDVVDGQVTTVHLDFKSGNAFRWINNQLEFDPGFDCEVENHHHHDDGGNGGDDDDDEHDD